MYSSITFCRKAQRTYIYQGHQERTAKTGTSIFSFGSLSQHWWSERIHRVWFANGNGYEKRAQLVAFNHPNVSCFNHCNDQQGQSSCLSEKCADDEWNTASQEEIDGQSTWVLLNLYDQKKNKRKLWHYY